MKFLPIFIVTILFAFNAQAADDDFAVIQNFAQNLQAKNYDGASQYTSNASQDLFKKYTAFDLGDLTPGNLSVVSQSSNNNFRYVKIAGTDSRGKRAMINVAMITENGNAKIDLPESMRLGFGDNWQQRVDFIEQSYLLAKQNLGEQQANQLLHSLIKKPPQLKTN